MKYSLHPSLLFPNCHANVLSNNVLNIHILLILSLFYNDLSNWVKSCFRLGIHYNSCWSIIISSTNFIPNKVHANMYIFIQSQLTHCPLRDLDVILNLVLLIGIFRSSYNNALLWMTQDLTDDKSTFGWVHGLVPSGNKSLPEAIYT